MRVVICLLALIVASPAFADGVFHQHAAWSPDGSRLAMSVKQGDKADIVLMDTNGTNRVGLTRGETAVWATWSADGSRVAYSSTKFGSQDIWVSGLDGGFVSRLTTSEGEESMPCFSWDGERIAYSARVDDVWQLFVMNADGSNQRRISNDARNDQNPQWSPDGSRLVFYASIPGHSDVVCIANADGSERVTVGDGRFPAWSPDGERIVFDFQNDIYIMNADGSQKSRFVEDGFCPRWSRDGNWIAFVRAQGDAQAQASEIMIIAAGDPKPMTVTGKEDTSLKTITGRVKRIDDDTARDGGVTIQVEVEYARRVMLYFGSLYTRPPPTQERMDTYRLIKTLRAGDKIEVKGYEAGDGYTIEQLVKLPGTIDR